MNFMSFSRSALNSRVGRAHGGVYARAGGVLRPALYASSRGVLHPALLESLSSVTATTSEE